MGLRPCFLEPLAHFVTYRPQCQYSRSQTCRQKWPKVPSIALDFTPSFYCQNTIAGHRRNIAAFSRARCTHKSTGSSRELVDIKAVLFSCTLAQTLVARCPMVTSLLMTILELILAFPTSLAFRPFTPYSGCTWLFCGKPIGP